ncbi:unnamed protein product [Protopolystoma xenopodis]|uniref:Uncharacterized protein n=1 Tax=Protopolystoma xenopodis TaxID=117903 RepID=A0A3S5B5W1_9PLAT|nr:unnamed protein product [Protopolystoma xenopodis]
MYTRVFFCKHTAKASRHSPLVRSRVARAAWRLYAGLVDEGVATSPPLATANGGGMEAVSCPFFPTTDQALAPPRVVRRASWVEWAYPTRSSQTNRRPLHR